MLNAHCKAKLHSSLCYSKCQPECVKVMIERDIRKCHIVYQQLLLELLLCFPTYIA